MSSDAFCLKECMSIEEFDNALMPHYNQVTAVQGDNECPTIMTKSPKEKLFDHSGDMFVRQHNPDALSEIRSHHKRKHKFARH